MTKKNTPYPLMKLKNIYRRLRAAKNALVTARALSAAETKLNAGFAGRAHGLGSPLIISLTSYPPRYPTLRATLVCLLTQSVRPDRVVLWIAPADMGSLPADVIALKHHGLEIREAADTGPFKKIIPALTAFPDAYIVTADDDVVYPHDWLSDLVTGNNNDAKIVACHRAHAIAYGTDGLPRSYRDWQFCIPSMRGGADVFATGAGGVLYPPGIFDARVLDEKTFMDLCHRADDIWLYWMARMTGARYVKVGARADLPTWNATQDVALWLDNVLNDTNDTRIRAMIAAFGWPGRVTT